MNPLRPAFGLISLTSVILSIVVIAVWTAIGQPSALQMFLRVGLINLLVTGFWWWFDDYGWRLPIAKWLKGLNIPPDLTGRWEGSLKREGAEENPHPFVIEIHQTYSRVTVTTFSRQSTSSSVVAQFVANESRSRFQLIHTWFADTRKMDDSEKSDEFYGTSIIEIENPESQDPTQRKLHDHYYTRRIPHTRGRIEVRWVGKCLGKFSLE